MNKKENINDVLELLKNRDDTEDAKLEDVLNAESDANADISHDDLKALLRQRYGISDNGESERIDSDYKLDEDFFISKEDTELDDAVETAEIIDEESDKVTEKPIEETIEEPIEEPIEETTVDDIENAQNSDPVLADTDDDDDGVPPFDLEEGAVPLSEENVDGETEIKPENEQPIESLPKEAD